MLYAAFAMPATDEDCGLRCAPYNEGGVPFCCDPRHAVPTAYREEWAYLQAHTDLWRLWQDDDPAETFAPSCVARFLSSPTSPARTNSWA